MISNIIFGFLSEFEKTAETQLEAGRKVEHEHAGTLKKLIRSLGKDPNSPQAKKLIDIAYSNISKDHLKEGDKYYLPYLETMEKALKSNKKLLIAGE